MYIRDKNTLLSLISRELFEISKKNQQLNRKIG